MLVGIRNRDRLFTFECSNCGAESKFAFNCPECTKEKWADVNHYHWLEENLWDFMTKFGVDPEWNGGIIVAHGDKCSGYRQAWEELGIPFPYGVAIYLLSYCKPYSTECRETDSGKWVDPGEWVSENYSKFFQDEIDNLIFHGL